METDNKDSLIESQSLGMEILLQSIPYPNQIEKIDLSNKDCIYFSWRSSRYRLGLRFCDVMMSNGCVLEGNDASILMERLCKNTLTNILINKKVNN